MKLGTQRTSQNKDVSNMELTKTPISRLPSGASEEVPVTKYLNPTSTVSQSDKCPTSRPALPQHAFTSMHASLFD